MNLLRLAGSTAPTGRFASGRGRGFTLIELLSVIAVIAVMLGISVMATGSAGGPQARRTARDAVTGMLTRARSEAVASGDLIAVVFVGFDDGPAEARGKAMSLYKVKRDEATGQFESVEQLRRWTRLPGRTVLLGGGVEAGDPSRALNALDEAPVLGVTIPVDGQPRPQEVEVPCIVFEPTGAVTHPPGSGRIGIYVGEGLWQNNGLLITAKKESGAPVADAVFLSRLTGRARSMGEDAQ